jgi:hypothetical protein
MKKNEKRGGYFTSASHTSVSFSSVSSGAIADYQDTVPAPVKG